jgi:hypothetical protein
MDYSSIENRPQIPRGSPKVPKVFDAAQEHSIREVLPKNLN